MGKKMKKNLSIVLSAALVAGSFQGENFSLTALAEETEQAAGSETASSIQLTEEDVAALTGTATQERTSVHDPSIVVDENGEYYVFGSHMGVSKSDDLKNWTSVTSESTTSTLFANKEGQVVSYQDAFKENAYTGQVNVLDAEGNSYAVDFGSFDASAWISDNTVSGNMWAPDVLYNSTMGKWCMYLSLNGASWNSSIILLTADSVEGPYVYQGPVVCSGFSTTDSTKSYKDTDLELVIGETEELPEKYQKIADSSWGTYWPHAIDPCVFYDEQGKLWMSYGSWSGGIYMLELDENNGLRDYTVQYADTYEELGASATSDPYFGTKIAGGYYVSGEGSYIQQIGAYYYLFMSYGFYSPEGGYNMRVFRSETPDGPYVDEEGESAIFNKYIMNYSSTNSSNNIGMKLMGNYKWDTMSKAEVAQGHNSAFVDADGKAYVVYHTKFADGTAGHEIRVHQMFQNEDGWLVAAPYEYSGETLSETGYTRDEVSGSYEIIVHEFQQNYASLEYQTPVAVTLNEDGTISGERTGSWSMTEGTPYASMELDGTTYKGVFTEQVIDGSNIKTMCFTVVSAEGLSIWGSGEPTDDAIVAQNAADSSIVVPENTYSDLTLTTEGLNGASISWSSSQPEVLSDTGVVTLPAQDTTVVLTMTISKGNYYYSKDYQVNVKAEPQNETDQVLLGSYFENDPQDLSKVMDGSLSVANPFYYGVNNGLNLSGGATIEFDLETTGEVHTLGTILSFLSQGGANGRLYFTPGSYLGYNAAGSYYDANLNNYTLVEDYIGAGGHVAISFTTTGFSVSVNDEVCYTEEILTTDNGAGTVTNYKSVLNWLYQSADTLYFGYGSWWSAAGNDEANSKISNVKCYAGPVNGTTDVEEEEKFDTVLYNKDLVELKTADAYTTEENPFYGKNVKSFYAEYTINFDAATAKNGWDGIFSFYNSTTGGRVSIQTAPYVCYNDGSGNWMDLNSPGNEDSTDQAPVMEAGKDYKVTLFIDKNGAVMTVDGEELAISMNSSGVSYTSLIDYLETCDQLTWGVGQAVSAYWNTEICTLKDVVLASGKVKNVSQNFEDTTLSSDSDLNVFENPFYGMDVKSVDLSYVLNWAKDAAKTGWDGIFSFYNSTTGGRVSIQNAPYVCYNDGQGNWIDLNNPNLGNVVNLAAADTTKAGIDYQMNITMDGQNVVMTIDGEAVDYDKDGSGATYEDMMAYIGTCDQFTIGVGKAQTSYWSTELCDLSGILLQGYGLIEEEAEEPEEPEEPEEDPDDDFVPEEHPQITKDVVEFTKNSDISYIANPFYKADVNAVSMEYTVNFSEDSAMGGWDGLFSFYNSKTKGRVSVQSMPYVCYNDNAGNWMDVNRPDAEGVVNALTKYELKAGVDYKFQILVTEEKVSMYLNGMELPVTLASSDVTGKDMIACMTSCDKFSYGVGIQETAYWNTELCTLKNISITPDLPDMEGAVITATAEGKGSVTGSTTGSRTTISAVPDKKYEFKGWYLEDLLIGTDPEMELSVCSDVTVRAVFEKMPYVSPISASYRTVTKWGRYLIGEVTVKNISEETLKSWSMDFNYEGKITSMWNASLKGQDSNVVSVAAPSWNKNLKSQKTAVFYFTAELQDKNVVPEPENFVITSEEAVDAISCEVSLTQKSAWKKGFVGEVTISNTGDNLIDSWTLEFDYADEISSIWGGKVISHEGTHYVIENCGYNSQIKAGEKINVGFTARPADNADYSKADLTNVHLSSVITLQK